MAKPPGQPTLIYAVLAGILAAIIFLIIKTLAKF
jgi:hypothetical protein